MNPLLLIRVAMMTGVLIFGGVTWFIRRSGDGPAFDAANASLLLWVARGAWGVAMVTCLVLFALLRSERRPARVRALSVIGWASGELVALTGGTVWFLTDNPQWYTFGLVFLVLTFLAFPAPRA